MSQYPPVWAPAPPTPPPEAPAPRRGKVVVVVAVVVVMLLVGGTAGFALTRDRGTKRKPVAATSTTTAAPPTTAPAATTATTAASKPGSVEAFLPEAERFVEQHRGLKFKQPVQVTTLDDAAFRKRLLDDQGTDKAEIEKTTKVLRALGLIPANTDVAKAEDALLGDAVAGFYDPKTKALVVRGVKLTPYVRQVIVHELTHALQDQYFGVDRPELDKADDERGDGFQALVEGDAVRVDGEYRASLSAAEQRQAENEENSQAGAIDTSVPPVLIELLGFPYQVGPDFTQAVLRARGQAGLDASFANPPTTTEQLLHPQKFLAGEGPKPVTAPPADGPQIDHGVLGEFGIDVVLEQGIADGSLTPAQVQAAGAGWGGDQYVAWDQGSKSCVRDRIVMDTARDTTEITDALQRFAAHRRGVTVSTSSSGVLVTSCG